MLTCKYKNVDNLNIEELELKMLLQSNFKMIFIDIFFKKMNPIYLIKCYRTCTEQLNVMYADVELDAFKC